MFNKYIHLERFDTCEVEGIEVGTTYIFPKLDGTNAQVWYSNVYGIQAGSRNRELSLGADNAGFLLWAKNQRVLWDYFANFPHHTLYGEWLVPHSLLTYSDDAWRKFYVFDVLDQSTGAFIHYENYKEALVKHELDYLAPLAIVKNGSLETYQKCLDRNVHLIKDGAGVGEGIVIKNYNYQNRFGRVTWAKLITNHFKEQNAKVFGPAEVGGKTVEEKIAEEFVTQHLVDKIIAKITLESEGWSPKFIPKLLGMVWHDLITEEIWEILKKHKNPKVDFANLNRYTTLRIKELSPSIF